MNKAILLFLLLIPLKIFSEECFIVTDLQSDKILYIDNKDLANRSLFPGSLLKAFTILSLDNNSEDITYSCTGWEFEATRCWSREGHGGINLIQALAYSCNSFFLQYLEGKLTINNYYKTLSKYLNFSGNIMKNEFLKQSIGLGTSIKTTPINILLSYNKIFREKPKGIEIIRQGMKESTYYGTGKAFTDITDIWEAGAKTGTSYHINPDGTLDWKSNTGWFLILYPADEPKYSFLKVIEQSKSELAVKEGSKEFLRWLNGI